MILENIKNIDNNEKYFNHDKSFFYHLKDIQFDLFLTLHYKRSIYYKNTKDSECIRRRILRELFGNISRYLKIPYRSIMYFGVSEKGSDNRIHSHILIRTRKDIHIENNELIDAIFAVLDKKIIRMDTKDISRGIAVVVNSVNASNYILKLKTSEEKQISVKEDFYHSKNFVRICESCKTGEW
jgi:hypothetical protein